MGLTPYYHMAFFDFGDDLDSDVSIQQEIDRFVLIDKQLYGLYNIFGNGVIDGWLVRDNGYTIDKGISILIEPGLGIIKYLASETSLPGTIHALSPNSINNVYATIQGSTVLNRYVHFMVSTSSYSSIDQFAIKIASVTTGSNSIIFIDNTDRELIGFINIIQDEIDQHKHRGTPSKIDLQTETKNQLSGARIDGIDASKIISGTFNIDRIPLIDHNELDDNGVLTHAALDSFVKTLSQSNLELLGEVSSVNLLRSVTFLKYIYSNVDEHFINELALIPGISPNSFIDFTATTANIDLSDQCISGFPAKLGEFTSVYWDDQYSLYNAYVKDDVVVSGGLVSLERSAVITETLEDFDYTNISPGSEIPNFTREIITTGVARAVLDNDTDNKVEGDMGGTFSASSVEKVVYTRDLRQIPEGQTVPIGRDWTDKFNELVIWVKTETLVHAPVYFYLINGEGENAKIIRNGSNDWVLLAKDEITTNTDMSKNNFEERVIDISNFAELGATDITQFVIYTPEVNSDFSFSLDNIHVRRENLFISMGTIRFRYSTETDIIFHSLFYNSSSLPIDTNIKARVKVASSLSLLSRSAYSEYLSSGSIFALSGSAVEIEVVLTTSDPSISPILDSVELRMLVDADYTGFTISDTDGWNRGTLENIAIQGTTLASELVIDSPINVDGYSFSYKDSVSEMDSNNVGVLGFSGIDLPISPNQAITWRDKPHRQFNFLTSIVRKYNKYFLVADTMNNRVLELNEEGELIQGFGSTYTVDDSALYPLTAVYNIFKTMLTVVFSKPPVLSDISKIYLYIGSTQLALTEGKDALSGNIKDSKILEIKLGEDLSVQLVSVTDNLFVQFGAGAFTEDIKISDQTSSLHGLYGMECFIGNFTYIDNIRHPIFINVLENNNWIVGNSSIFYITSESDTEAELDVPSIFEFYPFDPDGNFTDLFKSNDIVFSDFTLGAIYELDTGNFLVAGIKDTGAEITQPADLLSDYNDDNPAPAKTKFRQAASEALTNYRGTILNIDRINSKFQTFYSSPDGLYPSDISMYTNGDLVMSESSFIDASGRLAKIDSFANIIYTYGNNIFNIINDVKVVSTDNLFVSV